MGNLIIIVILLLIGVLAVRSSLKHFRGEGGCCGGGVGVPRQKKSLKHVQFRKSLQIEGMHCENCANRVERAINAIDGAAAKVNLKKKMAEVRLDRQIPDETLVKAVESAGYQVVAVVEKG